MEAGKANGAAVAARLKDQVGIAIGPSEWFIVDQPHIDAFGSAIDSHDAIHCDPVKAASSRFGGTIAQGFHIAGLMPKLLRQVFRPEGAGPGMAYGVDKLRYPAVVRCGRRVRLTGRLQNVEVAGAAALASFELAIEIEGEDKPACVAQMLVRYSGVARNG
jgi:acyl dehydratase